MENKKEILQFVQETIDTYAFTKAADLTNEDFVKVLKWLESHWIITRDKSREEVMKDLTTLINSLWLTATYKKAAKDIMELFGDKYSEIYEEHVNRENEDLRLQIEKNNNKVKNINEDWWVVSETQEKPQNEVSEELKASMKENYVKMRDDNKPFPWDLEKMQSWKGLKMDIVNWQEVFTIPGVGPILISKGIGTTYLDFDKNGERKIENIFESPQFKKFTESVDPSCKGMSVVRQEQLMNIVAQQLMWSQAPTINASYIRSVGEECWFDRNLPLNHPLWRIYRAMYLLFGDWFETYHEVNWKSVLSVFCDYRYVKVCDLEGINYTCPLAEIRSSSS